MTKKEKQAIEQMKTVAYWSGWGGLEVKKIEYGVEDYVIAVAGTFAGPHSVHRLRIRTTGNGRQYVKLNDHRFYMDDCLRSGI